MKYWRLLGHYNAETAEWSACAGALQTSPYTPDKSGRLLGVKILIGRTAATSLTDAVLFRLSCANWQPNRVEVGCVGSGLQTAPAVQPPAYDFMLDQPVQAGVPITVEGRCANASAVTNDIFLFGLFE